MAVKKSCPRCGRVLCIAQDPITSGFYAKSRSGDGRVTSWQSHCKDCQREESLLRRRRNGVAEMVRLTVDQRRSTKREQNLRYLANQTEEQRERRLNVRRSLYRKRQNEAKAIEKVDSALFVEWLRRYVNQYSKLYPSAFATRSEASFADAADSLSIDPSYLRRILAGCHSKVAVDLIDRTLVRVGSETQLWELLPSQEQRQSKPRDPYG